MKRFKATAKNLQQYSPLGTRIPAYAEFTLIELLVVIAVISVLMSLLLPALKRSMDSVKAISCLSNQKQTTMGTCSYVYDYDCYPSGNSYPNWHNSPTDGESSVRWWRAVGPYVKSTWPQEANESTDKKLAAKEPLWGCPATDANRKNQNLTHIGINCKFDYYPYRPIKPNMVKAPSLTIFYGDRTLNSSGWALIVNKSGLYIHDSRHRGYTCFTFCDGHAEKLTVDNCNDYWSLSP